MVYILIVIMHVNSGGIINFQEFKTLEACNYARELVYKEATPVTYSGAFSAFCVQK